MKVKINLEIIKDKELGFVKQGSTLEMAKKTYERLVKSYGKCYVIALAEEYEAPKVEEKPKAKTSKKSEVK